MISGTPLWGVPFDLTKVGYWWCLLTCTKKTKINIKHQQHMSRQNEQHEWSNIDVGNARCECDMLVKCYWCLWLNFVLCNFELYILTKSMQKISNNMTKTLSIPITLPDPKSSWYMTLYHVWLMRYACVVLLIYITKVSVSNRVFNRHSVLETHQSSTIHDVAP